MSHEIIEEKICGVHTFDQLQSYNDIDFNKMVIFQNDSEFNKIVLFDETNQNQVIVNSWQECNYYARHGWKLSNQVFANQQFQSIQINYEETTHQDQFDSFLSIHLLLFLFLTFAAKVIKNFSIFNFKNVKTFIKKN